MNVEEYKKQKFSKNVALVGMALAAAGQLVTGLYFDGLTIAFAALYVVAEYRLYKATKED